MMDHALQVSVSSTEIVQSHAYSSELKTKPAVTSNGKTSQPCAVSIAIAI